ncbi:MAG: acetolactate decarboxylase [Candidatus Bathyarchaeota archaeon]|nr:acetolactate decarboxylase [Candidatus Bathyarchaeota archaeon]
MQLRVKLALGIVVAALVLCSFFAGIQIQSGSSQNVTRDVLFQLSTYNQLVAGDYAGTMTYADLAQHGDFGIGTFDGLDGEMIALDGVFYQVPSSGVPHEASPDQTAPYTTITFFEKDQTFTVSNLNFTQLKANIDEQLPAKDTIYAIKVSGNFEYAQTRSPQKQSIPYPNITDALKTQSVFNLTEVSATAVGFFFPSSMSGVDYAGYHLHLITDDKTAGGHLLDCIIQNATVELKEIKEYTLVLP